MGYLSQASSPVADFSKCVISFLARVPTASLPAVFFEFGDPSDVSSAGLSTSEFDLYLIGPDDYTYTQGVDSSEPLRTSCHIGTGAPPPAGDTWHRYIISIDLSGGANWTYTDPPGFDPAFYTFVNNDFRFWLSVDDTDYSATSFLPRTVVSPPSDPISGPAGIFFPNMSGVEFTRSGDVNFPGFSIKLSGLEFAIPCLAANADPVYNPAFQIADFLMWTGVSLDTSVTANRRLFIDASGDPVNPSVAIAALGTPVYDVRGPASGIATNLGSAGNLTKTGTVTDYTPGP
jgi:hypothetical protein